MEVPLDSGQIAELVQPPKPRKRGGRRAPARVNGRLAVGRRAKQLTAILRQQLGAQADDPIMAAAICRAAETTALAEHMLGKALRSEDGVTHDQALRASRTADLLTQRLCLDRYRQPRKPVSRLAMMRGGKP